MTHLEFRCKVHGARCEMLIPDAVHGWLCSGPFGPPVATCGLPPVAYAPTRCVPSQLLHPRMLRRTQRLGSQTQVLSRTRVCARHPLVAHHAQRGECTSRVRRFVPRRSLAAGTAACLRSGDYAQLHPSDARAARTLCCDDVNAERAPRVRGVHEGPWSTGARSACTSLIFVRCASGV